MPEEVRAEISPWFIDRHAIQEEATEKIIKLDGNAKHVDSNLKVTFIFIRHYTTLLHKLKVLIFYLVDLSDIPREFSRIDLCNPF